MKIENIFVSGASSQTYFIFRLVSKINAGVQLVTTEKKCTYYSKLRDKLLIEDYDTYMSFLTTDIGDNTLFVCDGKDIQALIEIDADFFKKPNVFPNDIHGLSYFTDKRKTYQLCEGLGLPIVHTWTLDSDIPEFSTPQKMIAKWNVENINPKDFK